MARNRGQGRKAAAYRRLYDNRASQVQIRFADDREETSKPLDASELGRTVTDGNAVADPRPRSSRRTWSPPGS